jgi:hypothetical protein
MIIWALTADSDTIDAMAAKAILMRKVLMTRFRFEVKDGESDFGVNMGDSWELLIGER